MTGSRSTANGHSARTGLGQIMDEYNLNPKEVKVEEKRIRILQRVLTTSPLAAHIRFKVEKRENNRFIKMNGNTYLFVYFQNVHFV